MTLFRLLFVWSVELVLPFCEAMSKTLWNAASINLWVGLFAVAGVAHFVATLLHGSRDVVGHLFVFVDDVATAVINVANTVVKVASTVGKGAKDFFTGHWSRLGHEKETATGVSLHKPPIIDQLASLKEDSPSSFSTSVGRFLLYVSSSSSPSMEETCAKLRYYESISLTRWTVARPASTVLPGLCDYGGDDDRHYTTIDLIFRDLPVILEWIGTTGVFLYLLLVTCRPMLWWAVRTLMRAITKSAKETFCFILHRVKNECHRNRSKDVNAL